MTPSSSAVVFSHIVKTSKVGRNNEITQGRSSHEHGSVDHSNSSVGWGATSLALQFRLGILAKWRIGLGSLDCDHPRLEGARLNDPDEQAVRIEITSILETASSVFRWRGANRGNEIL